MTTLRQFTFALLIPIGWLTAAAPHAHTLDEAELFNPKPDCFPRRLNPQTSKTPSNDLAAFFATLAGEADTSSLHQDREVPVDVCRLDLDLIDID